MMTSTSNACTMRFFYYNNGNGEWQNKLKVYVRYADSSIDDTGTLFESKVSLPKWVKARVSHKSASPFQFVFSGELPDIRSSLSLDDVSFSFNCLRSDAQRTIVERRNISQNFQMRLLIVDFYFRFKVWRHCGDYSPGGDHCGHWSILCGPKISSRPALAKYTFDRHLPKK